MAISNTAADRIRELLGNIESEVTDLDELFEKSLQIIGQVIDERTQPQTFWGRTLPESETGSLTMPPSSASVLFYKDQDPGDALVMYHATGAEVTLPCRGSETITLTEDCSSAKEHDEVEQLRVQLAGCGVAARGGTSPEQRAEKGAYGWSASYQDVLEMREEFDDLMRMTKQLCEELDVFSEPENGFFHAPGEIFYSLEEEVKNLRRRALEAEKTRSEHTARLAALGQRLGLSADNHGDLADLALDRIELLLKKNVL